ncbi:UrcA family protein [Sphingobium sp. CR2-8]|uniref:UrcA family protein n=1 Tax=Sphingobium sp. CR2-8 TaxID=1306534 RepID=UPI002DBAF25E|nr:UrcA family protein [Sphingobium sp. CR2-8]MEC3911807.1 UrcA family protein [Sphingobium sp. CR2-8]
MFASFKFAAAVASAALLATTGVASAQEFQSNGRTDEVFHGDLNLSKAADQKVLRARILRSASRVCGSNNLAEAQACKAKAIAHVQAPINAAIARAETGERYADAGRSGVPVAGN